MANLFEYNDMIDEVMAMAVNEDGEIIDEAVMEQLNSLQMERAEKIDNCLAYYKSRKAMAEALKAEKKAIADRQRIAENEAESIKRYLGMALAGEKYESIKGKVSYRKSEEVHVDDITKLPEEYLKYKPEPNKIALKEAIKADGVVIDGAWIEEKTNTIIK